MSFSCYKRLSRDVSNNFHLLVAWFRTYLLVFEVDFLGSDAAPAGLELPRPLLQDAEFFISEGGWRGLRIFFTLHGIRALKGIVVHHLVLSLW